MSDQLFWIITYLQFLAHFRFLRDGYGTSVEDKNRRFYQAGETKFFDGIECQWPLFYIYLIIDGKKEFSFPLAPQLLLNFLGVFHENQEQVKKYWDLVQPLLVTGEDGELALTL